MSKRERSAALPEYLCKRGDAAMRKGNLEQASRYFTAALALDPESVQAKYGFADLEGARGNLEAAKEGFQTIVDSSAHSSWRADSLIALGSINRRQSHLDEAYENHARVLSMEIEETYPGEKEWMLAHAYNGMGVASARISYERALRLGDSRAKEALERLKGLETSRKTD